MQLTCCSRCVPKAPLQLAPRKAHPRLVPQGPLQRAFPKCWAHQPASGDNLKFILLALSHENGRMQPNTTPAESPATDRPFYWRNANPPLPVAELRNDELEILVGSRALFVMGQPPDVQAQVDERIRQAWDELMRRGVHQVPGMHWNYGSTRRKQTDDRLYDQDWYKPQHQWWPQCRAGGGGWWPISGGHAAGAASGQ